MEAHPLSGPPLDPECLGRKENLDPFVAEEPPDGIRDVGILSPGQPIHATPCTVGKSCRACHFPSTNQSSLAPSRRKTSQLLRRHIGDLRVLSELRRGGDVHAEPHDVAHAVQRT